jgi:hypothetical protein
MVPDSAMKSGNHPNAAVKHLLGIVPLNLRERRLIQQVKHIFQIVSLPKLRKEVLTMVPSQRPHERVPVLPAYATKQRPMTPIQPWLLHCSLHTSGFRNGTEGLQEPTPTGRISLRTIPIWVGSCRLGLLEGRGCNPRPFCLPMAASRQPAIRRPKLHIALRAGVEVYILTSVTWQEKSRRRPESRPTIFSPVALVPQNGRRPLHMGVT